MKIRTHRLLGARERKLDTWSDTWLGRFVSREFRGRGGLKQIAGACEVLLASPPTDAGEEQESTRSPTRESRRFGMDRFCYVRSWSEVYGRGRDRDSSDEKDSPQKPQGPSPVRKQHPWQSSQEFQLELAQARWPDSTASGGVQLVWLCVLGSQHVGDSLVTNVKVNMSLLLASGRLKEMLLDGDTNSAQVPGRPKDQLLLETWASTLAGR